MVLHTYVDIAAAAYPHYYCSCMLWWTLLLLATLLLLLHLYVTITGIIAAGLYLVSDVLILSYTPPSLLQFITFAASVLCFHPRSLSRLFLCLAAATL